MKPNISMVICVAFLCLVFGASSVSGQTDTPVPQLKGEVVFTVPWGDVWGKLRLEKDMSEGWDEGPEAMLVSSTRELYIYNGSTRRLHKFALDGKFITGGEIGRDVGVDNLTVGSVKSGARPIVVFDQFGYIGTLDKLADKPGPVIVTQRAKGAVLERTHVSRVLVGRGKVYVEERGIQDEMSYVRCYEGSYYHRRFEIVDLTFAEIWYYGLELDRGCDKLYSPAVNQVVIQRIDPAEATVLKEITLTLPDLNDKLERWHLLGAAEGQASRPAVFYFNKHEKPWANDLIHIISEDGQVIGTAKVAIPGSTDTTKPFGRGLNHLLTVSWDGILYLGIPDTNGLVIVRYKLPGRG